VITYCDGTLGGSGYASSSRQRAQQQAKNLLAEARFAELGSASAIILGNQSQKTGAVETGLRNMPIGTVWPADNFYNFIPKADGTETVTVYIADQKLRSQFEEAAKGTLDFEFELKGDLPGDKTITGNNQGTDIVVWIE
jgi:hypothetical protein